MNELSHRIHIDNAVEYNQLMSSKTMLQTYHQLIMLDVTIVNSRAP